jgi:uncharacterized protein with PQ loop repeat
MIEILGILGALFFGICAFPQVYKVWKTQDTESLSLMFLIFWSLGEIFMWSYVILENNSSNSWQWPLHINYLLNFISLGYLVTKKINFLVK